MTVYNAAYIAIQFRVFGYMLQVDYSQKIVLGEKHAKIGSFL